MPLLVYATLLALALGNDPATDREVFLRFYEVRDLAQAMIADCVPPELGLGIQPSMSEAAVHAVPERGAEPAVQSDPLERGMEALVKELSAFLQPPPGTGGSTLRVMPSGTLVANLTKEQHAWLETFLATNRTFGGLIRVQARLFVAPGGVLEAWNLAPSATLAGPREVDECLERIERDGRFLAKDAPLLTALPNQRANVSILHESAYVADWALRVVEPGPREIADPEIALAREGLVLDLRATPLSPELMGLTLAFEQVDLVHPIATATVRLGGEGGQEVEVGLPEATSIRFATTVVLAPGASAVLVTPHPDGEHDLALIVRVERTETAGH